MAKTFPCYRSFRRPIGGVASSTACGRDSHANNGPFAYQNHPRHLPTPLRIGSASKNRVQIDMRILQRTPWVQFPDSLCRFAVVQFSETIRVQFPDNFRIIDYQYRLRPLRLPTSLGNGYAYDEVTIGIYQTSYWNLEVLFPDSSAMLIFCLKPMQTAVHS